MCSFFLASLHVTNAPDNERAEVKKPDKSRRLTRQISRKLPIIWRSSYMYLVTRGITFCLHALSCLDILLCFMSEDAGSVGSCIPLSRRNHLYTFVFVLRSIIIFLFPPSIFVLFLQCDTSCLSILLFYSCLSIL